MKACVKKLFVRLALLACLGLLPADWAIAQSFTLLHNFSGFPSDGDSPYADLTLSGNTLFGIGVNRMSEKSEAVGWFVAHGAAFRAACCSGVETDSALRLTA